MKSKPLAILLVASLAIVSGCVERTMKITTRPPGAVVIVNDEEVGISPVKVSFMWYGDYDLMFRKEGYQTLKTHYRIRAPWWQWPIFDLITETMIIGTIRDQHVLPEFVLQEAEPPAIEDVVRRAVELRDRALFEGGD